VRELQLATKCRSLTSFGMTTPQGEGSIVALD